MYMYIPVLYVSVVLYHIYSNNSNNTYTLSDIFFNCIKRPSGSTSQICIKPAALEEVAATCFLCFLSLGPSFSPC